MSVRERYEEKECRNLSKYAVMSLNSKGRKTKEEKLLDLMAAHLGCVHTATRE